MSEPRINEIFTYHSLDSDDKPIQTVVQCLPRFCGISVENICDICHFADEDGCQSHACDGILRSDNNSCYYVKVDKLRYKGFYPYCDRKECAYYKKCLIRVPDDLRLMALQNDLEIDIHSERECFLEKNSKKS